LIVERGKRWRVVVQAGRDPITGKRHQLSGSAATEREALAMEREFRRRVEAGITGRILVRDLVEEWWASGPRLAPTTAANYKLNLDNHILPVLGDKRADEIRPRLVGQFLRRLVADGMHPATVRKVRGVLSAVMSYAVAME
jgi:integrase